MDIFQQCTENALKSIIRRKGVEGKILKSLEAVAGIPIKKLSIYVETITLESK